MTFSTLYWAEQHVTSGLAAVLSATGPMMILLIQVMQKKNGIKKRAVIRFCFWLLPVLFAFYFQIDSHYVLFVDVRVYHYHSRRGIIYGIGSNYSKALLNKLKKYHRF